MHAISTSRNPRWAAGSSKRANRDGGKSGLTSDERAELARLRKDNRELKLERDLLKKAAAFFAKESAWYALIQAENASFPSIAWMCCRLRVSTSGYYAWCKREPSTRSKKDEQLKVLLVASFEASRKTYGSRRRGYSKISVTLASTSAAIASFG